MKKRLLVRDIVEEDSGVYECAFSLNSTEKGRAELWSKCVCVCVYVCVCVCLWDVCVGVCGGTCSYVSITHFSELSL